SREDKSAESSKKAASESKAQEASKKAAEDKAKKQELTAKMTSINGSQQAFEIKNLPAKANQITFSADKSAAWVSLTANGQQIWQ
ncbi:hypothetical protein AADX85_15410, partial [Staphylococcus epidermidis]